MTNTHLPDGTILCAESGCPKSQSFGSIWCAEHRKQRYDPEPTPLPVEQAILSIVRRGFIGVNAWDRDKELAKSQKVFLLPTVRELEKLFAAQATAAQERAEEIGAIKFRDRLSTGGRPLSAPPLITKQPVPCPRCGDEEYADWTLYPHQLYNSYMPGGVGHYCFPCFAAVVAAQSKEPENPQQPVQRFGDV